ncbi:MAG: hypothetical protein COC24_006390 [Alphaproteobacteria bacterium]|nr:hypothetical protein [Alphaproteobacteria bacterium]
MSNNLQIVKQFVSDFYHSKPSDLKTLVNEGFTFSSNLSEFLGFGYQLNIDQYLEYSNHYYHFLKARDQSIISDDGVVFTVRFVLEVAAAKNARLVELIGLATITTTIDGHIDNVQICHFDDFAQYKRLRELKKTVSLFAF